MGGQYNDRGMKDMSFRQFVSLVLSEAKQEQDLLFLKMNVHWRPISAHGFFCAINYTVISKMETYNEAKKMFLKMVGIEEEIKERRYHVHGGKSIKDKTASLFKQLNERDIEDLTKLYKYDLELFDYNPQLN